MNDRRLPSFERDKQPLRRLSSRESRAGREFRAGIPALSVVWVGILACWTIGLAHRSAAEPGGVNLPPTAVRLDFSLPAIDGKSVELKTPADARLQVFCFVGCDCPVAKLYAPRLQGLAAQFLGDGVRFVAINSNPQDSLEKLADFAKSHGLVDPSLPLPMLKDHDGQVAAQFGATRTPEVFVVDPLGQVIYQGRIDDQYRPGVVTDHPTRDDLRIAIEEYLAGQPVSVSATLAAGCRIAKRRPIDPDADVTYTGQVSRILNRHCVECHREGEIGPFALTDYDEVVGWVDMMVEVIDNNRMPPWHASEGHAAFINSRRMSDDEKQALRRWVEAGAPYGDATQWEPPPAVTSGWQIGEPDLVLSMASEPFTVPAGGTVEYQYFVVDPGFTEDRWVTAAQVVPGNRSVVHHGIAFIRPPDGVPLDGLGWLSAYVPGQRMAPPEPHRARKIPAGSKIVFQMHYTPTGKIEQDLSKLGLTFTSAENVTEELLTIVGINQAIEILPRQADARIEGMTERLPVGGRLLAMSPHMHLRGKSFQVQVGRNSQDHIVLDVPHYDFNWQHTYFLAEPIDLDAIDWLTFTATYDNSAQNPFNPDPDDFVTWGDQTWEEMALVFYEVARPIDSRGSRLTAAPSRVFNPLEDSSTAGAGDATSESVDRRWQAQVDRFIADLDRNGDGVVTYDEVDRAVQLRLFRHVDRNGDRTITREEVLQYLRGK